MKHFNTCMIWLFMLMPVIVSAQSNWVSYRFSIPAKEHEGKLFRLSAMVRVEIEDDSASAGIWARVDKEKGMGFIDATIWHQQFRSNKWEKLSIEGTIDSGAVRERRRTEIGHQ